MKKYSILLAVVALVLASLACQTVMGGGNTPYSPTDNGGSNDNSGPAIAPTASSGDSGNVTVGGPSDFPITSDAFNVITVSGTNVTYQTKMSSADVIKFYRDEFGKKSYTEDTSMATTFGNTFTLGFKDGSGNSIYVAGADAGDGSILVTVTQQ